MSLAYKWLECYKWGRKLSVRNMSFDSITKKCLIIKAHCYRKIQKKGVFECNVCDFLNFSIFVREYRTRKPDTSQSKDAYVKKRRPFSRPWHFILERFACRSKLETNSRTPCTLIAKQGMVWCLHRSLRFLNILTVLLFICCTGRFDTLTPLPSKAKLGFGTYQNYISSKPYINSRLPCKFSEL